MAELRAGTNNAHNVLMMISDKRKAVIRGDVVACLYDRDPSWYVGKTFEDVGILKIMIGIKEYNIDRAMHVVIIRKETKKRKY